MASCDVFSCIRNIFISEEEYAKKAEENAKTLSQVFRSHVIESQCSLEEALRNASKHIKTLHAARAQNNAAAVAGANANVRACASQVRELKDRIERYTQQQIACDRAVCSLREGRQMKKTVSTLTDMQRRFRSLNLGTLQEASVRTMSDMTASHEELGDIRAILGQPVDQHISDPEADMRELEAMLLTDAAVVVAEPAPPHQVDARPRIAGAVKLPSTEDYILALASN